MIGSIIAEDKNLLKDNYASSNPILLSYPEIISWGLGSKGTYIDILNGSYGNNTYVSIGRAGDSYIGAIYSEDGQTFYPSTISNSSNWSNFYYRNIAFGNNVFVISGYNNNSNFWINYSSDGKNWSFTHTADTSGQCRGLGFLKEKNLFVIASGSHFYYSSDGINWNTSSSNITGITSIAVGDNICIGIKENNKLYYSLDGINWEEATYRQPYKELIYSQSADVFFVRDKFFIYQNSSLYISEDGLLWYSVPYEFPESIISISANKNFYILTTQDSLIYFSENGFDWKGFCSHNTNFYNSNIYSWSANDKVLAAQGNDLLIIS